MNETSRPLKIQLLLNETDMNGDFCFPLCSKNYVDFVFLFTKQSFFSGVMIVSVVSDHNIQIAV